MGCGASTDKDTTPSPPVSEFLSRRPQPGPDGQPAPETEDPPPDKIFMAVADQDKRFGGVGETMYSKYTLFEGTGEPPTAGRQLATYTTISEKGRIWVVKDQEGALTCVMGVEGKRKGEAFIFAVNSGKGEPLSIEDFTKRIWKNSADTGLKKEKELQELIEKEVDPSTKLFFKARVEVTGFQREDGITNMKLIDQLQYNGNEELGITYKADIKRFSTAKGVQGCVAFTRPNGDGNAVITHGVKHGDHNVTISAAVADPMVYVHAAIIKDKVTDTWRQ